MKVTNLYKPSEEDEQAAVIEFCDLFGIDVIHVPNEGRRYWFDGDNLKSERIEE